MLTSTKLSNILKTVQKQHDVSSTLLRPLCPTRVLCRRPALKCILNNLDCILVQQYADLAPSDTAAKAQGFANVVGHCNFVLGLKCAVAVLELLENLNRAVQSSNSSVASMITAMQMTADSRIIFIVTTRSKLSTTTPLCYVVSVTFYTILM